MQPSIAERFTWGRPYDPVAGDTRAPVVPRSGTALVGRILIAVIFVTSGFAKLADPASAVGYMNSVGVPAAGALVYVAGLAELVGGLAIAFGVLTRIAAIGLVVSVAITSLYFHNFWALAEPEAKMQMVQFTKNLAIMGGLLVLVAMGPGHYSIDRLIRRPAAP
jgi:putative oxidoreductase